MLITDLNQLPEDEARAIVRVWADVPSWVDDVVAARPFEDLAHLEDVAGRLAKEWTEQDLDAALSQHPRIGDRVDREGAEGDHSRREQSAMATAAADIARRIAGGTARYEEQFGRVFLIRAAGRSPEQILTELERRLSNDPETEWREAAFQLAQIAQLRLEAAIDDDTTPEAP
ncbi:2-oxo-4-hydroxy-4-carboxy-5-ureidoimidazoline decarboxylase [Microbacterium amylolyticum]|uniref:2-oxo-4-hydroxy-4-carboxy-5-ureidoimidazoline decarboxylase n=1 Tax=Microbacterium amylolyticum TaxID=936337 RepID=A0ABS4ZGY7_9MICO|nr:2-oxo-4-hydroxy-4-carboxy-5-ureidoimidazoline decarboxylase [Microbacterium amylolyticum]MBP2436472.1 2-oxo-4-hydroxy-4-carboxy-5-ureidoimidazoline decarboxylase [Microbacterium amylolyticum]